jgi:hypothetical protein
MKNPIPHVILVFFGCLCLVGCATQSQLNKGEVWNEIESIDDFIGEWEGSVVSYIPRNAENSMPESSIEITVVFEYIDGAERVESTMKMDMEKLLTDLEKMLGVVSGYTKDSLWELMVTQFEEEAIIGEKYFVLMDLSDDARKYLANDAAGKFQINKSKDKVRLIYYEPVTFGLGDTGFQEIIFNKK